MALEFEHIARPVLFGGRVEELLEGVRGRKVGAAHQNGDAGELKTVAGISYHAIRLPLFYSPGCTIQRVKHRLAIAAVTLLFLAGLGVFFARRHESLGNLEPYVVSRSRSYARIEGPAFGAAKPAVENYVVRESSLKGLASSDLEKNLQGLFSPEEGWVWDFVKDKSGTLVLASARRDQDEVWVTEIADGGCLVRHQKKAETRDTIIARVQNWGKDPFAQAPIEIRLGYSISVD